MIFLLYHIYHDLIISLVLGTKILIIVNKIVKNLYMLKTSPKLRSSPGNRFLRIKPHVKSWRHSSALQRGCVCGVGHPHEDSSAAAFVNRSIALERCR